jgi:hypothetical protein
MDWTQFWKAYGCLWIDETNSGGFFLSKILSRLLTLQENVRVICELQQHAALPGTVKVQ